jgi:pimeloyl-ACP methyl ester carboxylesterase
MTNPSDERFADVGRGITLCFDEIGDATAPPILMIAGLGQQLISWPTEMCASLADLGFRVIRFDNRDSGRSTHVDSRPPGAVAMMTGRFPSGTYNLGDMARDTCGLLDALGIASAHVVGASMGGMIAQVLASRYPERVRTLTSMFSATGAPKVGRPALSTWLKLAARPPRSESEAVEAEIRMFRHIGSHGFEFDRQRLSELTAAAWRRDSTTDGVSRQLAAILVSGDRTSELAHVTAPTLVVHGDRDRMVSATGGHATHRAIPNSELWIVAGMGHDYPQALWPSFVERIASHAQAAESPRDEEGAPESVSAARGRRRKAASATPALSSMTSEETRETAAI